VGTWGKSPFSLRQLLPTGEAGEMNSDSFPRWRAGVIKFVDLPVAGSE